MPPPISHPSHKSILLAAVVQRDRSVFIKHASSPNHPFQHPAVIAAQSALTAVPDFIFPSHLPPLDIPLRLVPSHPSHPPSPLPQPLPLSSSAAYLALSQHPSESNHISFKSTRPSKSPLPPVSRAFSNLSTSKSRLPATPTILHRPTSSPPPNKPHQALESSPRVPNPTPDPTAADDQSFHISIDSRHRQFLATLLSTPTHVFAITAQDGSRQYAFCRPLSSALALVIVTSRSHTPVYVSALEHTAAAYAHLIDNALSSPIAHKCQSENPSNAHCLCSLFVAESIMRCPRHIAKSLTEALLTCVDTGSLSSSHHPVFNLVTLSTCAPYMTSSAFLSHEHHIRDPISNVRHISGQCLTSSSALSALLAKDSNNPRNPRGQVHESEGFHQQERQCLWNKEANVLGGVTNFTTDRDIGTVPSEVAGRIPTVGSISLERTIELADVTLLLRHFSVRALISLIVALVEERRVCLVGSSTAVVSRAVLALENLVRPFKWPHLVSPILLAHILPVLGAPFPYLVGILEEHFPETKELPLEDVVFGDISSGKATTVAGPGELHRHIPRRIRSRLERRLARAKVSCTRHVLRARSVSLYSIVGNNGGSITESDDREELAKKEKPSLLKRSRSFVKSNEGLPQNTWLDYETIATIDKAMRKFFRELLEGFLDVRDVKDECRCDLDTKSDGFSQFLFQTTVSPGTYLSSSKRDYERRQLVKVFQRTQMYMQWREEESCDITFGVGTSEGEPQLRSTSRKRSKELEVDSLPKKGTADREDDLPMKSPKLKIRLTSDLDDVFSGEDGPVGDSGVVRKRFRGKRKHSRRQGVRQVSTDVMQNEEPDQNAGSNDDDSSSKPAYLHSSNNANLSYQFAETECETDFENEVHSRHPWLSLRLPSSPWNSAREWTPFSGREGDNGSEWCDPSDEGEETDPFEGGEAVADVTDMFPMENVGSGWTRMRQWSRRRNRYAARI